MRINRKLTFQILCLILTSNCLVNPGKVPAEVSPSEPCNNIVTVKKSADHASSFDYWINTSDNEPRTDWDINDEPIYGGHILNGAGNVNGNVVTVKSTGIANIYGGGLEGSGEVSGNLVLLSDTTAKDVYGGILNGEGNVVGNSIQLNDSTADNVYGGSLCPIKNGSEVRANTVTVRNSTINHDVVGGSIIMNPMYAPPSGVKVNNNIVDVINSTVQGRVMGGDVLFDSGRESGNMVNILEGSHIGDVFPGRSRSVLNIGNQTAITGNTLGTVYLSKDFKGRECSSNEMNVWSLGNTAETLEADNQDINFYIPETAMDGDTMLKVNETANIKGSTIRVAIMANNTKLVEGDDIKLIEAKTLNKDEFTEYEKLQSVVGISYDLNFDIYDDDNNIAIKIVPPTMLPGGCPPQLKYQTKIVAETRAAGMATLNSGYDLILGKGFQNAKEAADLEAGDNSRFTPFTAISGSKIRYNTGSHININGWGINAGMARKINRNSGTLTVAPLLEYGRGNYSSYLDDGTYSNGKGNSQFLGIGCLLRKDNTDNLYSEGSIRFGRLKSTFSGTVDSIYTDYDTKSRYFSMHAGVGKILKKKDNSKQDVYGRFFWTHQNDNTAHLTSGEDYSFDSMNSSRLRVGTLWSKDISKTSAFYAGAAYEYEFNGKARACWNGSSTPSPSLKGSSGMLELGWQNKITEKNPLSIDLGINGWVGKRKGIGFNAEFNWSF